MSYESKKNLLERLLNDVEEKRKLSIKEFSRSDLYNTNVDDVNMWYFQLKTIIIQNPPSGYCKSINIIEKNNSVIGIEYEYVDENDEDKYETSFNVHIVGMPD